jgi:hypothetical protein
MPDKNEVIKCLRTKTIAAIPDKHKSSDNRRLVQELLTDRGRPVKAFFFEWQQDEKLNAALSRIPFSSSMKSLTGIREDLSGFFATAALDAEPGIPELVATAVSNDIIAIASDANYEKVVRENLDGKSHFLTKPTGLAARDEIAAKFIAENIKASRIGVGRLLLWGIGHFEDNLNYGDCLHQCLAKLDLEVHVFS